MRPGITLWLFLLAGGAAAAPPLVVPSKLDQVLLYSTQAQVSHLASLDLTGDSATVGVADLPAAADPETVQVTCKSADVQRVEVTRTREQLPGQVKARELAEKIEATVDRLRALRDERTLLQSELNLIGSLRLQRARPTDRTPPDGIFVETWRRILSWVEARSGKASTRLLQLSREEKKEQRALHALQVQSRGMDLRGANDAVPRVLVTLKGNPGKHQVNVSYLVSNVRWVPTYDLGYDQRDRSVDAATYALVTQSTGEDWPSASLRFSTGRPTHLVAVPELPTWTLGRDRDFEPRPRPRPEPPQLVWSPVPRASVVSDEAVDRLRLALAQSRTVDDRRKEGEEKTAEETRPEPEQAARPSTPVFRPPPRVGFKDEVVEGRLERPALGVGAAPAGAASAAPSTPSAQAPPPPEPVAEVMSREDADGPAPSRVSIRAARSRVSVDKPTESLPWTEQGYRPPPLDPDSPAAAAEGYLYTLHAPGRHTVKGNGAAQRVPLSRQRFGISPVYRVRPALSQAAYLTATFSNNTGRPILRGSANLFAGTMYTGRTWLNTALPGRKIVLPLGVDDSVQVVRHLRQKTAVEGVVFKDDATNYTVAVEIANHRGYPVQIELEDQVPVKEGEKVEIRAYSSATFSKPDDRGKVTWKGSVAAGTVKKLDFSFQIVRPKDWELQQHDD